MHKNLGRTGNFLLSLSASWASIFLHVKAPENGGCGPLRELRLHGGATRGARDFRVLGPTGCSGLGGASVPPGLRMGRSSDRSVRKVQRPSGRRSAGCGGPFGDPDSSVGTSQSRSGDGRLLRKLPVRHRKPGCPADPGFRMGGAGRPSTLHFPAMAASPPRVGASASPGPRSFLAKLQDGLIGQGRHPQGRRPGPEGSRASGGFSETR